MVTVLGGSGYLGSVVRRRWAELGDGPHIVNCIFPDDLNLVAALATSGLLIQPSTDAVAEDTAYALRKRAVESFADRAVIIRAGIVDIRQRHEVAYANWWCNPLTPLEWADLAWEVRDQPGLHVAGRERLNRFNVAAAVATVFDTPYPELAIADEPLDRVQPCERTYPLLRPALIEFREWLRS